MRDVTLVGELNFKLYFLLNIPIGWNKELNLLKNLTAKLSLYYPLSNNFIYSNYRV